jgi:SOUL heme-binding protein
MAAEEPQFTVSLTEGACSVRNYAPMVAGEVMLKGSRKEAAREGFKLLAAYIFGGNTKRQSIAMTAPVIMAKDQSQSIAMTAPVMQSGIDGNWSVRFIMPSQFTLDTLPEPKDQRVKLIAIPASRYAVIQFSGLAHDSDVAEKTAELQAFCKENGFTVSGMPALARYDPPWTLWFMRRNEIMIALAATKNAEDDTFSI